MPTSGKVKKRLLKVLPKLHNNYNATILELGSGWGTLAFPLAKAYPYHQVIGYETSPIPYAYSKLLLQFSKTRNLRFEYTDFFNVNFQNAILVVCYLYPGAMDKLKDKFERELQPGTIVISHTFAIHGWTQDAIVHVDDLYKTPIYVYTIKREELKLPP